MEFGLLASFAKTPEASLARLGRQAQGLLKSLATFLGDRVRWSQNPEGSGLARAGATPPEGRLSMYAKRDSAHPPGQGKNAARSATAVIWGL